MFVNALISLLLWRQVWSVRLVELRVPAHEREGGTALLGCHYDLEGDSLYSVKWYKDNHEFYRYIPMNKPSIIAFKRPGVNVDLSRSSNTVVVLTNLTRDSAGEYACEVSGEAPNFITARSQKSVTIHYLPEHGPRVSGLKEQYFLDEELSANCTSSASQPEAHLLWLVNGKPAPPSTVQGPWRTASRHRPQAKELLTESTLQLRFIVAPNHFVNGAITIQCQATIAPLYQLDTKSTHYLAVPFVDIPEGPIFQHNSDLDPGNDPTSNQSKTELCIFTVPLTTLLFIALF